MYKNANELHQEHIIWKNDLASMKDSLIFLSKQNEDKLKKDTDQLLKQCTQLKDQIEEHEKKIYIAFKDYGREDYDDAFEEHELMRDNIKTMRSKLTDLRETMSKYH